MFAGENAEPSSTLVAYEDGTGNRIATPATSNGVTGLVSEKWFEWIRNTGHGRVIPKSDQGFAVVDLQDQIRRE